MIQSDAPFPTFALSFFFCAGAGAGAGPDSKLTTT